MVFPAGPKLTFSMLAAAAFPPIAPAMSWIIKLIMVLDMFLSQEPMPASQQGVYLRRRDEIQRLNPSQRTGLLL